MMSDLQELDNLENLDAETLEQDSAKPSEDLLLQDRSEAPVRQTIAVPTAQLKAEIEAALFVTGKALTLQELAEITEAPVDDVEMAIGELIQDYAFREGAGLEIDDTDGYILQVREDCARIVNKMMPLEMTAAALRTLSAIAIKAPILQSDLIELRGSTAYDHIAELLARKLVSKRRQGRSYILNTTKSFDEYFKLSGDKRELEALVNRLKPEQRPATTDEEATATLDPALAEQFSHLLSSDNPDEDALSA